MTSTKRVVPDADVDVGIHLFRGTGAEFQRADDIFVDVLFLEFTVHVDSAFWSSPALANIRGAGVDVGADLDVSPLDAGVRTSSGGVVGVFATLSRYAARTSRWYKRGCP